MLLKIIKKYKILIAIVTTFIVIRIVLPYVFLQYSNKVMAIMNGYYGHIEEIARQITFTIGVDTAQQIQDIISKDTESKYFVWATFIGVIIILLGATGVFVQFQKPQNFNWEVIVDRSKSVILSLLVTAILFETGKFTLGLYFGKADPASGHGAAGLIILILLWVLYSSMIVFYGAEYTHAFSEI